jgi:hypothetical protein
MYQQAEKEKIDYKQRNEFKMYCLNILDNWNSLKQADVAEM